MPFKLEEVDLAADFDELVACEWESFENPPQTFFRLYFPILGTGPDAHAEAIKDGTRHQLEWFQSDPTSYWQKVTDSESGKIIAGALWKICKTNPFEHPDKHADATWYPEGTRREFATKALAQIDAPRTKMARRPHLFLNILFVHPDYRRQGAGHQVLQWGIEKAEEMGVEMWLDASPYGRPVYMKHGFIVVNENSVHPETETPDEEWKKMERDLLPIKVWPMWRPAGGTYEEGKTVRPWEGKCDSKLEEERK